MRLSKTLPVVAGLAMAVAASSAHAQQSRLAPPKPPAFKPINSGFAAAQRPTGFATTVNGGRLVTDNGAGIANRGGNLISDRAYGFRPR